ncbi:transporter (plasmid) [Aureibacter tunicatorum]|nr:transporter [Aureibacter tunicatorum]
MSMVQGLNIVIPLLVYPYLVNVLGLELYGTLVFAQVLVSYFSILINYGFNIDAVKHISLLINKKEDLNHYISAVISSKFLLWFFSLSILTISCILINRDYLILYLLTFLSTFNELIFPTWFFQGIEKMKYVTVINTISRLLYLLLIFLFIKSESDYLLVPIMNGTSILVASFYGFYLMIYKEKIQLKLVSFQYLLEVLSNATPLFLSQAIISIKDRTSQLIIGVVLGMGEVAIFDLGMKISNVIIKLPVVINQTIFPKVVKDKNMKFVMKISNITFLILLIIVSTLWYLTPFIITLFTDKNFDNAVIIIRILMLSPIFLSYSTFFGNNCLLIFDKKKEYMNGMLFTTLFYLFLIVSAYLVGMINSILVISLITVLVYLFEMIYRVYYSRKLKLI